MPRRQRSNATSPKSCERPAAPAAPAAEATQANLPVKAAAPTSPDQRVHQVFKWILSGATERDIVEAIHATWPDVEARPLIVRAMKQIEKSGHFNPTLVVGWCFEATRDLYRRMVEIGDFASALRAVKQLADLAHRQQ